MSCLGWVASLWSISCRITWLLAGGGIIGCYSCLIGRWPDVRILWLCAGGLLCLRRGVGACGGGFGVRLLSCSPFRLIPLIRGMVSVIELSVLSLLWTLNSPTFPFISIDHAGSLRKAVNCPIVAFYCLIWQIVQVWEQTLFSYFYWVNLHYWMTLWRETFQRIWIFIWHFHVVIFLTI